MTARDAAAVLAEIAYLLRHEETEAYRARAYSRASAALIRDNPDLVELHRRGKLESIDAVGPGIARVLVELLETGGSAYLARLREAAAPADAPPLAESDIAAAGYRGDLHTHTDWSDGGATVMEMALAAQARGYQYLAITDHSPRMTIVKGLDPARLVAQRRLIEAANRELTSLTVMQGIEVDILEDGSLDLPDDALAALDIVIASPHLKLRMERAAMTERMLRAVEHPHVDVIGHPTGRRPGSRPGADYDFEMVFAAAARRGVALEIDCDPARMDLSPELARLAAGLGCNLTLDSDAHYTDQLVYVDQGIWMARRAGLEPDRLLNWMTLPALRGALGLRV